jgi:NAD(P)-dependent dehydrogenase (short-subunit alcohol dehydrogenase family)
MPEHSLDLEHLFSLQGKVALVTGGSRGIGYMISQGLLQAGARVYISARKAEPCQQAATELSQYGECIALPGDVSDPDSRRQLCEQLAAAEPHLGILVNNAGAAWGAAYEDFPDSAFDKVMRVNVTAMFALTRDLTPMLAKAATQDDPARVINIGSMEGLHIPTVHGTGNYAYTTSKAAVHHLTRHLAVELGRRQITVNAIAPGFFPSRMSDHVFEHRRHEIEGNSLLGRVGKAQEMAGIAVYLCGRSGGYTHGAVIPVDGGTSINHQHAVITDA